MQGVLHLYLQLRAKLLDPMSLTRMHGNDERVSVESLRQGTEMIYRTLVDVAARK